MDRTVGGGSTAHIFRRGTRYSRWLYLCTMVVRIMFSTGWRYKNMKSEYNFRKYFLIILICFLNQWFSLSSYSLSLYVSISFSLTGSPMLLHFLFLFLALSQSTSLSLSLSITISLYHSITLLLYFSFSPLCHFLCLSLFLPFQWNIVLFMHSMV